MALVVQREKTELRPGFREINANMRRIASRKQQLQSLTGAEITVPVTIDLMMHKKREENIGKYAPNEVMGNNIGHDYEYIGVHDNDPIFMLKEPSRSNVRNRHDPEYGQCFSSMVGYHFGKLKTQEQLTDRLRFVGFATAAISFTGGRLPSPNTLAVRVAGAGTAEFTGNDVIEPGQLVTWEAFSINDDTRKQELAALTPPQLRPAQKLVPILRTLRSHELVDYIGDSAAESFFDGGFELVHQADGFSKILDHDYMDNLSNTHQMMLNIRNFAAVQGFIHILGAIQAGIVSLTAAPAQAQLAPVPITPQQVMTLADLHGLAGKASTKPGYLDTAFARAFRGVLPLAAHERLRVESDISGLLPNPQPNAGPQQVRDWTNRSNIVMGLVHDASQSTYDCTVNSYWDRRSRAIAVATTAAGPGERFNYVLLMQ